MTKLTAESPKRSKQSVTGVIDLSNDDDVIELGVGSRTLTPSSPFRGTTSASARSGMHKRPGFTSPQNQDCSKARIPPPGLGKPQNINQGLVKPGSIPVTDYQKLLAFADDHWSKTNQVQVRTAAQQLMAQAQKVTRVSWTGRV